MENILSLNIPLISPGLRLGFTFIITLLVISSPIVILVNPVEVSAAATTGSSNRVDTSNYHSTPQTPMPSPSSSASTPATAALSVPSQDGDFTTQAALSLTRATQTSNIVDSKAYYDVSFRTSTAGVIKFIRMSFPTGTYVGASLLVEATGIGPGKISADAGGNTLTYTVTNAVNVPANTNIRLQISNVNNPADPSSYTVSITTRNAANAIIDGPTTAAYNMKQIGTGQIADEAVTSSKIADGTVSSNDLDPSLLISKLLLDNANGASAGWNPNGMETDFIIFDEAVEGPNAVLINVADTDSNSQCEALGSLAGFFTIRCITAPPQGSELRYTVTNVPIS